MKYVKLNFFIISILFILGIPFLCYADANVTEQPNIRIVINGETVPLRDVPLLKEGRTLLPLRELLNSLNVPNDDDHIIWDGSTESVTFLKDGMKVLLKVGDRNVIVNDKPITLDVEPLNYNKNSRVYVPTRFVAETLGYKVTWDEITKTVYISTENNFKTVNQILNNTFNGMSELISYKESRYIKFALSQGQSLRSQELKNTHTINQVEGSAMIDSEETILMDNEEMKYYTTTIFKDNFVYYKTSQSGKWGKEALPQPSQLEKTATFCLYHILKPDNILCSGLKIEENKEKNEYILTGSIIPNELIEIAFNSNNNIVNKYNKVSSVITIDKDSNYVKKYSLTVSGNLDNEKTLFEGIIEVTYSNLNETFDISIPDEYK